MANDESNGTTLNPEDFSLNLEGKLKVIMPPTQEIEEADIDAQLFSYISNAPKGSSLTSLKDLDDNWVQANFPDFKSIAEFRDNLRFQLEREQNFAYESLKFARSTDVLINHLQGEIPQSVIDANFENMRIQSENTIHSFGETIPDYLRRANLSEDEYMEKIREETYHNLALNMALDLYATKEGISVSEDEITQYLSTDDPDAFLAEIREADKMDEARIAAARVKAMRHLVAEAEYVVEDDE